jgi:hypothetical protein
VQFYLFIYVFIIIIIIIIIINLSFFYETFYSPYCLMTHVGN